MRLVSTIDATVVAHDGGVYEAGPDGTFDLPESVGQALAGFPHWQHENDHLASLAEKEAVDAQDPVAMAAEIVTLKARIAQLETKPARKPRAQLETKPARKPRA